MSNLRRKFGRRFTAVENAAIEERAVLVTREHFENELGYETAQPAEQPARWWVNDHGIPATADDPQELGAATVNGTEIKALCYGKSDCRLLVEISDGVWGLVGKYPTPYECGVSARELRAFLLVAAR